MCNFSFLSVHISRHTLNIFQRLFDVRPRRTAHVRGGSVPCPGDVSAPTLVRKATRRHEGEQYDARGAVVAEAVDTAYDRSRGERRMREMDGRETHIIHTG